MIKSDFQEKEWLKNLRDELIEDRKLETGNASPLFYTLMQPYQQIVPNGYEDGLLLYNIDTCESQTIEEVWNELSNEEKQKLAEDYLATGVYETENGTYDYNSEYDLAEYLANHREYSINYYENQMRQVQDTLFLTRKQAEKYLKTFGYNHPKGTVTYAMTAVRSFQFEHLLELLHNIDWEHSQLVFTVPETFVPYVTIKAPIEAYVKENRILTEEEQKLSPEELAENTKMLIRHMGRYAKRMLEKRKIFGSKSKEKRYNPNRLAYVIDDWQKEHPEYQWKIPFTKFLPEYKKAMETETTE